MANEQIKINELVEGNISLSDFIAKAGASGIATKITLQKLADVITSASDSQFKGALAIADTPGADGWYFPSESGTYTNAGGLVVTLENNLNIIIVSETQSVFSLLVNPITIPLDAEPSEGSTNAVESGGVAEALAALPEVKNDAFDIANEEDAASMALANSEMDKKNVVNSFIDIYELIPLANKTTVTEVYKEHNAIKADIASSSFQINSGLIPISDFGLNVGDTVNFSSWIGERGGKLFMQFFDVNDNQIESNSMSDYIGFGSLSNVIPVNTVSLKYVIIVNQTGGIDYAYIYNTIISNSQINIHTIGSYKSNEINVSKIPQIEEDLNTIEANIANLQSSVFTVKNLIFQGEMNDLSEWSSGSLEADGIRVSGTSTLISSDKLINLSNQENLSVYLDVTNNLNSDSNIKYSFFAGGNYAYQSSNILLKSGINKITLDLPNNSYTPGGYKIYVNAIGANCDVTISKIVNCYKSEADTILLKSLYDYFGFGLVYSGSEFSKNAATKVNQIEFDTFKSSVDSKLDNIKIVLKAYFTTDNVSDDPSNGVFAGTVSNINAIQRAINSIDDNTDYLYEVRCYEDFITNDFADMAAVDAYGRNYQSFVSLTGKQNIKIVGTGNKKTLISCILPNTGAPVDYKWYQTVTFDCKNCELENLEIVLQNGRYAIHTESQENIGSTLILTNIKAEHKGNTGQALSDWASLGSYTFGVSSKMKIISNNCHYKSITDSGFGGHDQYNEENSIVELNNCFFSSSTSPSKKGINFKLFGNNLSKLSFVLNGNNFGNCKLLDFGKNSNSTEFYGNLVGSGNSKYLFKTAHSDNYYSEVTDVLDYLINTSGSTIPEYKLVSDSGLLSSGKISFINIEEATDNAEFRAIKNNLIELSKLTIKAGQTINVGDYVEADSGELIISNNFSNAKIISTNSITCLSF